MSVNRSYMDSFEKIVSVYFQSVTRQPFEYNGVEYLPKNLRLSPTLFRGFICHKFCGACCRPFGLTYLLDEKTPYMMNTRPLEFNGKVHAILEDDQADTEGHHCKHVDKETGWCGIHKTRPMTCDFELLRFLLPNPANDPDNTRNINFNHQPFGRAWTMQQVDGTKGVQCEFTPVDKKEVDDIVRKLERLKEWTDEFELVTCLPIVIHWVKTGPHSDPLVIPKGVATVSEMDEYIRTWAKKSSKSKPALIASTNQHTPKSQRKGFFHAV